MGYFVYKTTNSKNGKFYIGVHSGDVDDQYLGSGKIIKQAIRKYGSDVFVREIIAEFDELGDALRLESKLVDAEFLQRPDVYNVALGGGMPPTMRGSGHPNFGVKRPDASRRMRDDNPMKMTSVREKVRGTAVYILDDGSMIRAKKDDPRLAAGAVHVNSGKLTVRDSSGKVLHVTRDDPRLISGEVVHVSKGLRRSRETVERWRFSKYGVSSAEELSVVREQLKAERRKNKPIDMVTCPHCGKSGKKSGAMAQHHFDNCKKK